MNGRPEVVKRANCNVVIVETENIWDGNGKCHNGAGQLVEAKEGRVNEKSSGTGGRKERKEMERAKRKQTQQLHNTTAVSLRGYHVCEQQSDE